MSRRSRRQSKNSTPATAEIQRIVEAEVARRLNMANLPSNAVVTSLKNQDALLQTMQANQAPSKDGTPMFAPGAPLIPAQALVNPNGPRQFQFPVGYNIQSAPRSTEETGFDTLRNFAALYDGAQLCEQVWLDSVAKLNLVIKPRPELLKDGEDTDDQYADDIAKYKAFFEMPDPDNGLDLKAWLRMATRETLQIDALCVYVRKNRAGGVYSLEIVDGTLMKPLLDARGRRPQPPFPAYQEFLYGVPAGLYTADEMLYFRETVRAESVYGLSRNERIIMRVNQALRKQNKDLSRFTEGNVPAGTMEPPDDGSAWLPEDLMAYQETWDALLAGNDQARSRIKVIPPGTKYNPIEEKDIFIDFDRFLLNVTTACYSMTMADLGFTENVNKSSGESQENVFYRRALMPLIARYADMFTMVLRKYFNEQRFIVSFTGFEESEDFNAMAASYIGLVNAGIIKSSTAARLLNLPVDVDVDAFVLTKEGPVFLEDAADPTLRKAQLKAKVDAAKNPPPPPGQGAFGQQGDDKGKPGQPQGKGNAPPPNNAKGKGDNEQQGATTKRAATADPLLPDGVPRVTHSFPWRST